MKKNIQINLFNESIELLNKFTVSEIVSFLHKHLDKYRDNRQDIEKQIQYQLSTEKNKGGYVVIQSIDRKIVGCQIINDTGMEGYIPEHVLVYIQVNKSHRGIGIGKKIINFIKENCDGDIALHVERDNPAVHLYKRLGFKIKYYEMRLSNK